MLYIDSGRCGLNVPIPAHRKYCSRPCRPCNTLVKDKSPKQSAGLFTKRFSVPCPSMFPHLQYRVTNLSRQLDPPQVHIFCSCNYTFISRRGVSGHGSPATRLKRPVTVGLKTAFVPHFSASVSSLLIYRLGGPLGLLRMFLFHASLRCSIFCRQRLKRFHYKDKRVIITGTLSIVTLRPS